MNTQSARNVLSLPERIAQQILAWDDTSRHEPLFDFDDATHYFLEGVLISNPEIVPGVAAALKEASKLPSTHNQASIAEMADLLKEATEDL